MILSNLVKEGYYNNNGVSIHQMALGIHSMAEAAWEDEHGEYPNNEEMIEAIKGVLSELHKELKDVIKEYEE